MWFLKNSKELLEHFKSPSFNHVTSIKSFDFFPTLYTTIPHQKLKISRTRVIRKFFIFKNGNRKYKYRYLVSGNDKAYFVKEHSDSKNKFSEDDLIKMLGFLVDNIFLVFARNGLQQTVGIPICANSAPLLAKIFLDLYKVELIQSFYFQRKRNSLLASLFTFTNSNLIKI